MPDIEMIRKLCGVLDITKDEILDGSVADIKKTRRWMKGLVFLTILGVLLSLFFGLDGMGYIKRNTQSGIAYLTVFENGKPLKADDYSVTSDLKAENYENGYKFNVDYGEIRGIVHLSDEYQVEYGFVNTNNWHNIQIRLDIERDGDVFSVKQAVSYVTDNDVFDIHITEEFTTTEKSISVFREGV